MTQAKKIFQPVTSNEVCQIYELLHAKGLVSFALNSECSNKIDTIVANINATYFSVHLYSSAEEKAVAYLYFLIKDHPFIDGNKRTAVITFQVVCDLNSLIPKKDISQDALAVFIEKTREPDHRLVIKSVASLLFDKLSEIR